MKKSRGAFDKLTCDLDKAINCEVSLIGFQFKKKKKNWKTFFKFLSNWKCETSKIFNDIEILLPNF